MHRHIIPYCLTLAVAVSSISAVFDWPWFALPVGFLFFFVGRYTLQQGLTTNQEEDRYKKHAESIAMAGMLIFLPLVFTSGITSAMLVFVSIVQLGLNYQTFSKKQFYLGLLLSFALIMFAASESRDGAFLLFFIPYVLFLCATLFGLSVDELELEFGQWMKSSGLLLALTCVIYLLMPRFSPLLWGATPGSDHFYFDQSWVTKAEKGLTEGQDDTSTLNYRESSETAAGSLRESLKAQEDSLTRQMESGKSGAQKNERGQSQTGFERHSEMRLNHDIVMQVRSDVSLYLTTEILNEFDGLSWFSTLNQYAYIQADQDGFALAPVTGQAATNLQHHYEVEIISSLSDQIPLAWHPNTVNFPAQALKRSSTHTLKAPSQLKKGTAYSAIMSAGWDQGRLFYPATEGNLYPYLGLPSDLDPRVQALILRVVGDEADLLKQAILLEQHLRENYAYTLDTVIRDQNRTDLSTFLFETRYGHCEYFASALAIMLRLQGIPSRVVNGYAATDRNPLTGFIEVRGTDAHAWTEGYFDGLGWVPFEPTSYYQLPSEQRKTELAYEQVNDYVERQLDILKQTDDDWSVRSFMLNGYAMLTTVLSIAWLYIKWFFLHFGQWLVAMAVAMILGWFAWVRFAPKLKQHRLKQAALTFQGQNRIDDYEFWMVLISKGLALQQRPHAWSTVKGFINTMQGLKLMEPIEGFEERFNALAYGGELIGPSIHNESAMKVDLAALKETFDRLWID